MQHNVSPPERFASVALGSLVLARGLTSQKGVLARFTHVVGGAGLVWRGLSGFCPLFAAMGRDTTRTGSVLGSRFEKTILINKNLDEVREILGEGDPVWRTSDSTLLPLAAGDRLWDLRLREADARRTLIHASLTNPDAHVGLHGQLQINGVMQALENELRKLKALIETGEIPTIEGQPTGRRHRSKKPPTETLQERLHAEEPTRRLAANSEAEASL